MLPAWVLHSLDFNFPSPWGGCCRSGKADRNSWCFMVCCCFQLPMFGATGQLPWASPNTHLYTALWSPGSSTASGIFLQMASSPSYFGPSSLQDHGFSVGTLLFGLLSETISAWLFQSKIVCVWRSTVCCQHPNWWFCLVSLSLKGLGMCHFCWVQIIYNSLHLLQPGWRIRLLSESSELQFWTFTHRPTQTHLSAAC